MESLFTSTQCANVREHTHTHAHSCMWPEYLMWCKRNRINMKFHTLNSIFECYLVLMMINVFAFLFTFCEQVKNGAHWHPKIDGRTLKKQNVFVSYIWLSIQTTNIDHAVENIPSLVPVQLAVPHPSTIKHLHRKVICPITHLRICRLEVNSTFNRIYHTILTTHVDDSNIANTSDPPHFHEKCVNFFALTFFSSET